MKYTIGVLYQIGIFARFEIIVGSLVTGIECLLKRAQGDLAVDYAIELRAGVEHIAQGTFSALPAMPSAHFSITN